MDATRQNHGLTDNRERLEHLGRRLAAVILAMNLLPLVLVFFFCRSAVIDTVEGEQAAALSARSWALAVAAEKSMAGRLSSLRLSAMQHPQTQAELQAIYQSLGSRHEGFLGLALLTIDGDVLASAGAFPPEHEEGLPGWLREVRLRGESVGLLNPGHGEGVLVAAVTQDANPAARRILAAAVEPERLSGATGGVFEVEQFLVAGEQALPGTGAGQWATRRFEFPGASMSGVLETTGAQDQVWQLGYARLARFPLVAVAASPAEALARERRSRLFPIHAAAGASALIVTAAGLWLAYGMANRMRESEKKRELAFREMEHTQKLSSIGRLAAGVAHEINNPLAIINEKAGLMKDLIKAAGDFPKAERFNQLAESILQSVARCRAITHRLLGFARRMEVQAVQLDLGEVIREVLGFLEREAMYRQVKLELNLAEGLPLIETDRGQMQQVFLNLLNNALAAVEDGGSIKVTTWQPDNGHVAAEVRDNGHGMSRDTLKHIFEPFFSTKGDKGSGLGLSITYGIVAKLGGDIRVESEPGKGTSFTVILPRTVQPSEGR